MSVFNKNTVQISGTIHMSTLVMKFDTIHFILKKQKATYEIYGQVRFNLKNFLLYYL